MREMKSPCSAENNGLERANASLAVRQNRKGVSSFSAFCQPAFNNLATRYCRFAPDYVKFAHQHRRLVFLATLFDEGQAVVLSIIWETPWHGRGNGIRPR